MKRWMKKAVAFGLAVSLLSTGFMVQASEVGDAISVIESPKYDAAIAMDDNVVLVENGHWGYDDTNYETGENKIITDVTTSTNVVFVNSDGSKKVISNKDANGEKIFDAVHPAITHSSGHFIRLIKDNKAAYLNPDGSYIGEEGKFYAFAHVVNDNKLLVSDDGVNFKLEGVENADTIALEKFRYIRSNGSNIFISIEGKFIVMDEYGKKRAEYTLGDELAPNPRPRAAALSGGGYYLEEDNRLTVYNSDLEEAFKVEKGAIPYTISNENPDYLMIAYSDGDLYQIVSADSGDVYKEFSSWPQYGDDFAYGKDLNGNDIYYDLNTREEVNITNIVSQIAEHEGLTQYEVEQDFSDGYLSISFYGYIDGRVLEVSYLLSVENGFSFDKAVRMEGTIKNVYKDKNVVSVISKDTNALDKIYTLDGVLIKEFPKTTIYELNSSSIDNIDGIMDIASVEGSELFEYDWYAVKTNGDILGPYDGIVADDRVLFAETYDERIEVISGDGVVGSYAIADIGDEYNFYRMNRWFYSLKKFGYYASCINGQFGFYDIHGNKVEGATAGLSGVGPCESFCDFCTIPTELTYIASYYCYANYDLENGLCVTRRTDENGEVKYGVVSFAAPVQRGDCNSDGVINAGDALAILKHAAKLDQVSDESIAEVTGDGLINAEDALKILKYAAKLIDSL